jgi:hypothetical protein
MAEWNSTLQRALSPQRVLRQGSTQFLFLHAFDSGQSLSTKHSSEMGARGKISSNAVLVSSAPNYFLANKKLFKK